ncbi:MAG: hypothetical protein HC836_04650 [Richelia sp. RM2_1_2]|nr:hypothetical protein [Richelia sp. RM2_1_2]
MVLAVVGTMKAGKSTTINTIVGFEVLPNRNYPMTSLPTLIRHRIGQKTPILKFSNHQPIQNMVKEIRRKLMNLQSSTKQLESLELYKNKDDDTKEVIRRICNGNFSPFQDTYQGQENIFNFLKMLNDLIRLAGNGDIKVELPIDKYENVNDLPIIEVEFCHLADVGELFREGGQFSILDTPGPNEFMLGDNLRKVLNSQIARASAVLAVVDYSQLRSNAEYQIRQELESQVKQTKERLFILVNKFDQTDRNSMNFEDVKSYVAENFLQHQVTQGRVYPVSAKYGYLSNCVLNEIKENSCLPNYENENNRWIEDFGKLAFGVNWKEDIQDINKVKSAAEKLWNHSNFEKPINEVIVKTAGKVGWISIQAATDKMLLIDNQLANFLQLRSGALSKGVEEIEQLLKNLTQNIKEIENAESQAEKTLKDFIENSTEAAHLKYETTKKVLKDALKDYFKKGQRLELTELRKNHQKVEDEELQKQKNPRMGNLLQKFLSGKRKENRNKSGTGLRYTRFKFDPNNPKLTFKSEEEASHSLEQLNETIIGIINDSAESLENALLDLSNNLEETLPQILEQEIGDILNNAKKQLKDEGFTLKINIPNIDFKYEGVDFYEMLVSSFEPHTEKKETKKREKIQGLAGEIPRFLGRLFQKDNWGYKELKIEEEQRFVIVDMERIEERIFKYWDDSIDNINENHQVFFKQKLKPVLDKYFSELKDYLKKFRGDLQEGIEDKKLNQEKQQDLLKKMNVLKERVDLHKQNIETIQNHVNH